MFARIALSLALALAACAESPSGPAAQFKFIPPWAGDSIIGDLLIPGTLADHEGHRYSVFTIVNELGRPVRSTHLRNGRTFAEVADAPGEVVMMDLLLDGRVVSRLAIAPAPKAGRLAVPCGDAAPSYLAAARALIEATQAMDAAPTHRARRRLTAAAVAFHGAWRLRQACPQPH